MFCEEDHSAKYRGSGGVLNDNLDDLKLTFYNETENNAISPTPVIGGIGLISNLNNIMNKNFKKIDSLIIVIGKTSGHLYQSEFFREIFKIKDGPPPEVNLFNEKNNGLVVQEIISKKLVNSVHDISSGGILVTLAEMCINSNIGAEIKMPRNDIDMHEYLFGEDQSRYIIEVDKDKKDQICQILEKNSTYYEIIGKTKEEKLSLFNEFSIKIEELNDLNSYWFKNYFK